MTENPSRPRLNDDPADMRDDLRPPGTPAAGIAPGQIDEDAALAATHDGAGEPLPPVAERRAKGLGAPPTPGAPQADHAPDSTPDSTPNIKGNS